MMFPCMKFGGCRNDRGSAKAFLCPFHAMEARWNQAEDRVKQATEALNVVQQEAAELKQTFQVLIDLENSKPWVQCTLENGCPGGCKSWAEHLRYNRNRHG